MDKFLFDSRPQQPAPLSHAQELEQSIEQVLQHAVNHHRAGQIQQAQDLYRAILQIEPSHPDANHNLGLLEVQAQRAGAALPYFEVALEARPEQARYWLNYIDALIQAAQVETARQVLALGREHGLQGDALDNLAAQLAAYPQAMLPAAQPCVVETSPPASPQNDSQATKTKSGKLARLSGKNVGRTPKAEEMNTVLALYDQGRTTEVEKLARSLSVRFPLHVFGWKVLGAVLQAQGRAEEALLCMQKAAKILPGDAIRHSSLGSAWQAVGQFDNAVASYRRALEIEPDDAVVHSNLGNALKTLGQHGDAVASYRRAQEIKPDDGATHSNLGNALQAVGQLDDAVASYRRALAIKPDDAIAHSNLGTALQDLGQIDAAVISYRRALAINPDYAIAHSNLGGALKDIGQFDAAVTSCRRALAIKPDYAGAHNNLGIALKELGQFNEAAESYRRALAIKPDYAEAHSNLLFCLSHSEGVEAQALFGEYCRFGDRFEAPLRANWPQHTNSRNPDRCLQVGFVSGDLRDHALASFIEPVLAQLAGHPQLSLHAYHNHPVEDSVTRRLRGYVAHWHPIVGLSDMALAQKIRSDGIDILIDLSGHTARNRLPSFARHPAPVQLSWMGFPGTTGLAAVDYYLSDRFFLPPGQFDDQFTEKLVYLPAWAPFLPFDGAPPVNPLPALNNGYITFGSFNRPNKMNPSIIALWSQLLRALPTARMIFGAMPKSGENGMLIDWFAREGIAVTRLSFYPHSDMQSYLALHHQVDVCLDTFPFNGNTITNHALWMGVPTLTLAGATIPGRAGAALLSHVGLESFIAQNKMQFVETGLHWASHPAELADIRDGLRARFKQSAIGQPAIFAAALECALRTMWRRWCAGLPAESFAAFPPDTGTEMQ